MVQCSNERHFVSVVVITKNNAVTIEDCIASLLNQTYPRESFEVIFVDGNSTDGTGLLIKRHVEQNHNIALVYENYGRMGYARNLGVSQSKGDIIAFTDGDAFVPTDWIQRIAQAFDNDSLAVLGGRDLLVSSTETNQLIDSWRRLGRCEGIKAIPCIKTVNFAVKRDSLIGIGGFDPNLSHWDEAELMARLYSENCSSRILYDPDLSVSHKRPASSSISSRIRKVFKKSRDGVPVLMRKHVMRVAAKNPTSSIGLSSLMIPLCLSIIGLVILSAIFQFLLPVIAYGLVLYGLLLCVYVAGVFRSTHRVTADMPLFLTLDFIVRFAGTCLGLAQWLLALRASGSSEEMRHSTNK